MIFSIVTFQVNGYILRGSNCHFHYPFSVGVKSYRKGKQKESRNASFICAGPGERIGQTYPSA